MKSTWEPKENLAQAPLELADYKARVGLLDSKVGKRIEIEMNGPPLICLIVC